MLDLPGGRATHALVLSEDDWNSWANDCVIVPIYPSHVLRAGNQLRVETRWGTADCTRVFNIGNPSLTAFAGTPSIPVLAQIRRGVRSFLCVDALLAQSIAPEPLTASWYPKWAYSYYSNIGVRGERKMHAILSDNAWNSEMDYVSAVRLTSKSKESRVRWEVPVKGGPVIVGDLHLFAKSNVIQKPPRPPRPGRLTNTEMVDMGHALERLLTI